MFVCCTPTEHHSPNPKSLGKTHGQNQCATTLRVTPFRHTSAMSTSPLIGYARISTTDQDPALQLDALNKAGCIKVFTDTASGAKESRPELDKMLEQLRPGDTLVVWRLDRLGRSLKHLLTLIEKLEARGVGFRSLTESIDTTTAGGRLVLSVFGAMAEFERSLIRERTRAGLEAARSRGRHGGRPSVMTEAKTKMARELWGSGNYTAQAIADELGVSRRTICRVLEGAKV